MSSWHHCLVLFLFTVILSLRSGRCGDVPAAHLEYSGRVLFQGGQVVKTLEAHRACVSLLQAHMDDPSETITTTSVRKSCLPLAASEQCEALQLLMFGAGGKLVSAQKICDTVEADGTIELVQLVFGSARASTKDQVAAGSGVPKARALETGSRSMRVDGDDKHKAGAMLVERDTWWPFTSRRRGTAEDSEGPGNTTAAPSEANTTTAAPADVGSTTAALAEANTTTAAPADVGSTTSAPAGANKSSAAPAEAGNTTAGPAEATASTAAPPEANNTTAGPAEATTSTAAPPEADNTTAAPAEATTSIAAAAEAENTTAAPAEATTSTAAPAEADTTTAAPEEANASKANASTTPAAVSNGSAAVDTEVEFEAEGTTMVASANGLREASWKATAAPANGTDAANATEMEANATIEAVHADASNVIVVIPDAAPDVVVATAAPVVATPSPNSTEERHEEDVALRVSVVLNMPPAPALAPAASETLATVEDVAAAVAQALADCTPHTTPAPGTIEDVKAAVAEALGPAEHDPVKIDDVKEASAAAVDAARDDLNGPGVVYSLLGM